MRSGSARFVGVSQKVAGTYSMEVEHSVGLFTDFGAMVFSSARVPGVTVFLQQEYPEKPTVYLLGLGLAWLAFSES